MTAEELHEQIKNIKFMFFTFRSGAVADSLHAAGDGHKTIMGLMVPQLASIARQYTPSMELADALWQEKDYREARLLACYLFPPEEVDEAKARELMDAIVTPEEADMLAFRLLKRLPFAAALLEPRADEETPLQAYSRKALARHLK